VVAAAALIGIGLLTGEQDENNPDPIASSIMVTPDLAPIWWSLSGSIRISYPTPKLEKATARIPTPQQAPRAPISFEVGYAKDVICAAKFTWPCDWAIAVAICESTLQANVVGGEWYRGQYWYFYGWFQIASLTPPGGGMDWLLDPVANTAEGHYKYITQGVGAWPNCP